MTVNLYGPAAGYKGKIAIGTVGGTGVVYPYSNTSIAERKDIIVPSVNGFAGQMGVVTGAKIREGNIVMPILGPAMLNTLLGLFVSETARTTKYSISLNNGFSVQTFQCFLKSITVSAEPGQGVTADISIIGGVVDVTDSTPVSYTAASDWAPDSTFLSAYGAVQHIPYHKTKVTSTSGGLAGSGNYWELVSGWSFTIDNNTGSSLVTAYSATVGDDCEGYRLHQGQQTGEGRLTLLNPFKNSSSHENIPDWSDLSIACTAADASTTCTITLYQCINHTYGVPLPEPNTRITQSIGFNLTTDANSTVDHILFTSAVA